jgi:thiol-disulfide isomerase/thioredoxin
MPDTKQLAALAGVPHLESKDVDDNLQISHDGAKINQNGIVMVQADWCGHCKNAKPDLKKLYEANKGKYFVGTVFEANDKDLVKRLKVGGFPAYFGVKNGKILLEPLRVGRDQAAMQTYLDGQ